MDRQQRRLTRHVESVYDTSSSDPNVFLYYRPSMPPRVTFTKKAPLSPNPFEGSLSSKSIKSRPEWSRNPDDTKGQGPEVRNIMGKDSRYEFITIIKQGGFGNVAKVRRVNDGKIMACKAIDCSSDPSLKELASHEISNWASFALSEKYIANFSRDCTWNDRAQTMRLYMDYYEGGDLQSVIDACRHEDTTLHPFMATHWAMEIARGVKACHDRGIIHRDLKPANVLLAKYYNYNNLLWAITDGAAITDYQKDLVSELSAWFDTRPPWCHITDFGLGKLTDATFGSGRYTLATTSCVLGTPGYIAPETFGDNAVFSVKSDVYSLGCLLYSLCSLRRPPSIELPGGVRYIAPISKEYPKRMRDIISRCMEVDPMKRPNSRDVANEISEATMDLVNDPKFGITKARFDAIAAGGGGVPS